MKKQTKLKIALIAVIIFVSIQIALALQVPAFGDYDNDGDIDLILTEIIQNQDNETFYEMNTYYNISPVTATYGFFINVNGDSYLDVYLVYSNVPNKLLIYNSTNANFTDITATAGVGGISTDPIGANTADFDNDGNADLFANNHLYFGHGNGSFTDVTNESNLEELPRLKAIIPWDFNEDNRTDIIGLHENGTETILMLNMNDNNGDNIPEFWDATTLSQLTDLTKTDLTISIANSVAVGWMWNHTYNATNDTYLVSGIYLPRNGVDILLDTYLSSKFKSYIFAGIPEFRWLNISDLFTGNTTSIMQNSTDAVFVDLDNNTVDDFLIAGTLTSCYRYGSSVFVPINGFCKAESEDLSDPNGEGISQSTNFNYIIASADPNQSPNLAALAAGGRSVKVQRQVDQPGSITEETEQTGGEGDIT